MHRRALAVFACLALLSAGPAWGGDEDLNTQLMRATVLVSHPKSAGTGFVLSRPDPGDPRRRQFILVTAAHVFENIPGDAATLAFRQRQAEGVYKKVPAKIAIRKDGKPCWTRHPSADVAVLVVVPPERADLPRLSVDLLATDAALKKHRVHPGDELACLGYPHRIAANEAGFAILRRGAVAGFPLVPTQTTRTFLFSANTFEGDSGGPVYLADPQRRPAGSTEPADVRLILGLVSGQHFLDEEMKMVYGTTKLRHRLSLAVVVHASFIREAIARLP